MPAERVDWRHEAHTQFQVHPLFEHKPSPPALGVCPLESLPVFLVHKAVIRHCSLSHLATALPQPSTGPTYGPSVNTMS